MGRLDLPDPVRDEDVWPAERDVEFWKTVARAGPDAANAAVRRVLVEHYGEEVVARGDTAEADAAAAERGGVSLRELQVLELMAEGLTNGEAAAELGIGEETIKTHVRAVLAKLEARSRTHAVTLGFRKGLIQ